jgi:hypothetical protein
MHIRIPTEGGEFNWLLGHHLAEQQWNMQEVISQYLDVLTKYLRANSYVRI